MGNACKTLFVNANVLLLNLLYYEPVLNLMHNINERNLIPLINILNLFFSTSKSHHYSTRSSTSQNMYVKNLDLICKRMRSLVLAQGYGMKGQIALKTYQGRPSEKKS